MKIIEITAGAATSFNHPHESYANFKPSVTIKATLDDSDDSDAALRLLQADAYDAIFAEKQRILDGIEREETMKCLGMEIRNYEGLIAQHERIESMQGGALNDEYERWLQKRSIFGESEEETRKCYTCEKFLEDIRASREKVANELAAKRAKLAALEIEHAKA